MNSKIKFFLLSMLVVQAALIFAEVEKFDDSAPVESTCETKSHKKTYDCLRVKKLLRVCGNEEVLGNLSVAGNTTLNNLAVNGDLSLTNTLVVNDIDITNATINNLTVTSSVVLPSPLTLGALIVESINLTATTSGQVGVPGIGGSLAYGQLLKNNDQLSIGNDGEVTFNLTLSLNGMVSSGNGLTVTEPGIYKIDFQARGYTDDSSPLLFGLGGNTVEIPNTTFASSFFDTSVTSTSTISTVNGSVILSLNAGDNITVLNLGAQANLVSQSGMSASLTIEKIAA